MSYERNESCLSEKNGEESLEQRCQEDPKMVPRHSTQEIRTYKRGEWLSFFIIIAGEAHKSSSNYPIVFQRASVLQKAEKRTYRENE